MRASLLLVMFFSFLTQGAVENFQSRFSFAKNPSGDLTEVRILLKSSQNKKSIISVPGFWEGLKREIKEFQGSMGVYSDLDADLALIDEAILPEMHSLSGGNARGAEEGRNLKKSLRNLKNVNLSDIYTRIEGSGFIKKFQQKIREAFLYVDPTIIARPGSSNFFYKRNVGNQVAKWAIGFIQNRFSSVPVLNTALYMVKKMMDFVRDQRAFHQNLFLYYVRAYTPEQLGLTKLEVDTIVSSIFESRISLTGYQESKLAQENWERYGFDKFYKLVRTGLVKRRKATKYYKEMGQMLGYAFSHAQDKKGELIINLFERKHMFSKKPAIAINLRKPARVLRTRTLVYLAQLGLSFVPMPGILKSAANRVADSFYVDQGKTEGALLGYFEDKGNDKLAKLIIAQSVNPFLLVR